MPYYPEPPHADDIAQRGMPAWKKAVLAHRAWAVKEGWTGQARGGLDLSNPDAMRAFWASRGITNEIGGGRHLLNLLMGNLPSEGFGMSSPERGISYAMEAYMPAWRWGRDRAVQHGMRPGFADNAYFPWSGWNTPGGPVDPRGTGAPNMPGAAPAPVVPTAAPEDPIDAPVGPEDPWDRARKKRGNSLSALTNLGGQDALY